MWFGMSVGFCLVQVYSDAAHYLYYPADSRAWSSQQLPFFFFDLIFFYYWRIYYREKKHSSAAEKDVQGLELTLRHFSTIQPFQPAKHHHELCNHRRRRGKTAKTKAAWTSGCLTTQPPPGYCRHTGKPNRLNMTKANQAVENQRLLCPQLYRDQPPT